MDRTEQIQIRHSKQPPLLKVENFSLSFRVYRQGLQESILQVMRNMDLTIDEGEIVAVVGASGSGKSILANAILGLLPEHVILNGTLRYKGKAITRQEQEKLRGKEIMLIPQSTSSLDPLMKVGKQVRSIIKKPNKKTIQQEIFQRLDLPMDVGNRYPFELSGGMMRRVLIAIALASNAKLIIADELTPGLDNQVLQDSVMAIKQLASDGKGVLFITHDISTALQIADKVAVMNAGKLVEMAEVESFTGKGENLQHSYTKALWNALPENEFILEVMKQSVNEQNNDESEEGNMTDARSNQNQLSL